jgi:hypothetical protein
MAKGKVENQIFGAIFNISFTGCGFFGSKGAFAGQHSGFFRT